MDVYLAGQKKAELQNIVDNGLEFAEKKITLADVSVLDSFFFCANDDMSYTRSVKNFL